MKGKNACQGQVFMAYVSGMNRKVIVVALIAFTLAIAGFIYISRQPASLVDPIKIFAAAQQYTRILNARHLPIPPSVSLKELIAAGLLKPADIRGFNGAEVTVFLTAKANDPKARLMRARFPDGQEIVTLADGSIQTKP